MSYGSNYLDPDRPGSVRLSVGDARALGEAALARIGYGEDDARIITDQLIDNSLCGYRFAGLPRILAIAREAKTRDTRCPVAVVHETHVSALVDDADGNLTQDGRAAARGGVAAFGGHKGYGLAFAIQALGLLAGAAIPRGQVQVTGFCFWLSIPRHSCPGTRSRRKCHNWSRRSGQPRGGRALSKSASRRSAPSANASAAAPKASSSTVP